MNTIYKDGKEICQCIQYDGENIKEVGYFLKEHKINWHDTRGWQYIVYCTHGEQELNKTDWLLKRQNDFVVMTDKDFQDTYNDMVILRPLCTDFTNMGNIGSISDGPIGLKIDPSKEKFQVSNLKPLVIPPTHSYKQIGDVFKSEPVLSREDEFVLTITTAYIKTGTRSEITELVESVTREVMAIADKLNKEHNHGN